ncbi:hypothetical protein BH23ACT9_BH23ACT9_27780 [soil metagenome]
MVHEAQTQPLALLWLLRLGPESIASYARSILSTGLPATPAVHPTVRP